MSEENTVQETPLKWWQGTNFWVAASMFILGGFSLVSTTDVSNVIAAVFGIVGSVFAIREGVKLSKFNFKEWISSRNTWNYLASALTAILPGIPLELFTRLNDVATAAIGKNYQGIVAGLLSLATIIYFWITGNKQTSQK